MSVSPESNSEYPTAAGSIPGGSSTSGEKAAELLRLQYQILGEHDSSSSNLVTGLGGIAAAVAALWFSQNADAILLDSPLLRILVPTVALLFLSFIVHASGQAMVREKLFRYTERQLSIGTQQSTDPRNALPIPVPAIAQTSGSLLAIPVRLRGGLAGHIAYRLTGLILYIVTLYAIYLTATMGTVASAWATLVYSLIFIMIGLSHLQYTMRSDDTWRFAVSQTKQHARDGRISVAQQLIPRASQLAKASTMVLAWGTAVAFVGWESNAGVRLIISVFLFEFLFYQARYQLNDLRGIKEDTSHPGARARARKRIEEWSPSEVRASVVSMIFRLVIFALLTWGPWFFPQLSSTDRAIFGFVTIVMVGVVILYEKIREKPQVADHWKQRRAISRNLTILLLVGMICRGILGFQAATSFSLSEYASFGSPIWGAVLCCTAIAFFSVSLNSIAWALESCPAGSLPPEEQKEFLATKPHVWYFGELAGLWSSRAPGSPWFALSPDPKVKTTDSDKIQQPRPTASELIYLRPFGIFHSPPMTWKAVPWFWGSIMTITAYSFGTYLLGSSIRFSIGALIASMTVLTLRLVLCSRWRKHLQDRVRSQRIRSHVKMVTYPIYIALFAVLTGGLVHVGFTPGNVATASFSLLVTVTVYEVLESNYRESVSGLQLGLERARHHIRKFGHSFLQAVLGKAASERLLWRDIKK